MTTDFSYRGLPRTSEEWAALAGRPDLSRDELRRLFMLGLVDRQFGRICLSMHGRATLGLRGEILLNSTRRAGWR